MGLLQSCISPKNPSVAINVLKRSFYYIPDRIHWGLALVWIHTWRNKKNQRNPSAIDQHGDWIWTHVFRGKVEEKECIMKSNKQQCSKSSI